MVILSEHRESKDLSFLRALCALPISVLSVLIPGAGAPYAGFACGNFLCPNFQFLVSNF